MRRVRALTQERYGGCRVGRVRAPTGGRLNDVLYQKGAEMVGTVSLSANPQAGRRMEDLGTTFFQEIYIASDRINPYR